MKKICTIILMILFATKANAYTAIHEFDVFIGKFNASRTNFAYNVTKNGYAVNSNVKTYGVFDTLYPFQALYSTAGKLMKDDKVQTMSYKYESKSRFTNRSKELVYDDKGEPQYIVSTKNDKEKTSDINRQVDIKGTTDLQTVLAKLILQYNKLRFCDARMEVFDGKRRFDVIFKDEGQDIIRANKYSALEGEAYKCSMFIDRLSNDGDDLLWQLSSNEPVYFWIMEEKETNYPFIARAEIKKTPYGKLQVYTRKINFEE